jgi:hypothetical protein
MNLDQAALFAQIVSAVCVIASLIFVGFQLRQATAAIRASSSQAHSELYTALVQPIINDGDFARIFSTGVDDPSSLGREEWVRFVAYSSALFRQWESSRVQWRNGRLDADHWHTIERQAMSMCGLAGIRAAWKVRGHMFTQDFRRWFEGLEPPDAPAFYGRDTPGS